ncbi:helix-turn-helix domain-containing protein [Rhodococcus sp. BE178]|uniref:helix-turn-helix domain-containing protein n=1 Tax=Rhodococcus sp. BE178 TaxID=2817737 RepID=UPI003D21AD01
MPADAETGVIPEFDLTDRMRKALRHRGETAIGIAEFLGVTRDAVGRWLNGTRKPSVQTLRLWALHTGVDYRWLSTGEVSSFEA